MSQRPIQALGWTRVDAEVLGRLFELRAQIPERWSDLEAENYLEFVEGQVQAHAAAIVHGVPASRAKGLRVLPSARELAALWGWRRDRVGELLAARGHQPPPRRASRGPDASQPSASTGPVSEQQTPTIEEKRASSGPAAGQQRATNRLTRSVARVAGSSGVAGVAVEQAQASAPAQGLRLVHSRDREDDAPLPDAGPAPQSEADEWWEHWRALSLEHGRPARRPKTAAIQAALDEHGLDTMRLLADWAWLSPRVTKDRHGKPVEARIGRLRKAEHPALALFANAEDVEAAVQEAIAWQAKGLPLDTDAEDRGLTPTWTAEAAWDDLVARGALKLVLDHARKGTLTVEDLDGLLDEEDLAEDPEQAAVRRAALLRCDEQAVAALVPGGLKKLKACWPRLYAAALDEHGEHLDEVEDHAEVGT